MYSFRNDYSEGAHPKVLQALTDTNLEQTCGYGLDPRCDTARDTIRRLCAGAAIPRDIRSRKKPRQMPRKQNRTGRTSETPE